MERIVRRDFMVLGFVAASERRYSGNSSLDYELIEMDVNPPRRRHDYPILGMVYGVRFI